MPDAIAPVGAMIQPPNPNQGLSQLSSILGVRQAQQNLQTGAIQQQTAAALAQQQQLEAQKQQGVQNFFRNWDPSAHLGNDGTTDLDSVFQDPQFKDSGNAKPAIMQSLLDIKNHQLGVKQQLTNLNGDLVKQFTTQMGSLKTDPDVMADKTDPSTGVNAGRAKFNEALSNFSQLSPDAARVAQIYGQGAQHAPPGKLSSVVTALQLQGQSASEQQAQQNPQPMSVDTGGQTNIYNVNKATGLQPGQQPVQSIPKAPQQVTLPNQQLGNRDPRTGAVSPAPMSAGAAGGSAPPAAQPNKLQPLTRPGPNAPKADQDAYNAQIAESTKDVAEARNAANDPINGVQSTRFRNQQIIDLIPHAATGPGMEMLNAIASRLPGATGDAYQDIEHYTAQNSAALAQKMGLPHTNLGAETSAAASGSVEKNPGALAEITKTNDALNTAFKLYNAGLQKLTNNGSDLSKVNSYKQAFGSNLDVNAVRWADAHRRGDQDEIDALDEKLGKDGVAKAKQTLKILKSLSETGDLP